jgi:RHS repeat-associated protein
MNYFIRIFAFTFILLFNFKIYAQQVEHRAEYFNFGQSGSGVSISNHDFIAKNKIELSPNSEASIISGTHINLSIDKTLQLPIIYDDEATSLNPYPQSQPIDYPINMSLPVGSIAGQASVSADGSANYGFSIYAPPGTNNMTPKVSISYNSNNLTGIAGRGWNISGLSSITRVAKDIYHDQVLENIQLSETDILALDGNRLIKVAQNSNVYRPEKEDFSLVTDYGNYFIVITNSGLTLEYGKTPDSKVLIGNTAQTNITTTWFLNKITDNFGNYSSFTYNNNNEEVTLKEIAYTGNSFTSLEPYNFIRFYYDKRKDENTYYQLGKSFNKDAILREIEVFCEGKSMKRYKFNYTFANQSFLREITEFGADNSKLNSTFFRYGNSEPIAFSEAIREDVTPVNSSFNDPVFDEGPLNINNTIFADFNGDGKSDELSISVNNSGNLPTNHIEWKLWLNDAGVMKEAMPLDPNYPSIGIIHNYEYFVPPSNNENGGIDYAQAIDINGDELDDLVIATTDASQNSQVFVYYSNGTGFKGNSNSILQFSSDESFLFIDFDGDGQLEALIYKRLTPGFYMSSQFKIYNFNTGVIFTNYLNFSVNHSFAQNIPIVADPDYQNFRAADFDGDGKQEVLCNRSGVGACFIKITLIGNLLKSEEIYNTPICLVCKSTQAGDFNGDGITDYSYLGTKVSIYYYPNRNILYGTGNGFIDSPNEIITTSQSGITGYQSAFFSLDLNEDGIDDLLKVHSNSSNYSFNVFYNAKGFEHVLGTIPIRYVSATGNDFIDSSSSVNSTHELSRISIGDIDGDGKRDFFITQVGFGQTNSGCIVSAIQFNKGNSNCLLTEIVNGYRNKSIFHYKTLSNGGNNVYKKLNNAQFPVVDEQTTQSVVTKHESSDGIGGYNYASYKYEGLKRHAQGLGNLGFEKMSTYNSASNTIAELTHTTPEQSNFYERSPLISKTFLVKNQGPPTPLSERTFVTDFIPIDAGERYIGLLTDETFTDFITGSTIVTNNVYNSTIGLLTSKHSNLNNGFQITDEIYTPYTTNTGSWLPNKIQTVTINTKRLSEDQYSRTTNFIYDAKGNLETKITDPSTANEVSVHYIYDVSTGLLIGTSIESAGLFTQTSGITYDLPFWRFPVSITNTLNQVSEAKFDPRWGKPIWQKGIDGLISELYYDGFGQAIKSLSPDNTISISKSDWVEANEIATQHPLEVNTKALFSVSFSSTGKPTSKVYYDSFGRQVFSVGEGFGKTIYSAIAYNAMGSPYKTTSSYDDAMLNNSSINNIVFTETLFDDFNRISEIKTSDGITAPLIVQYKNTYLGNGNAKTKVIAADGKKNAQTLDAMGLLIESEDDAGTKLTYSYYSSGQLKNTSLSGSGIVNSMEYLWGRLTKVDDINSGITTTTYNAYGLPITQTDANLKTSVFTYDTMNRVVTKTCFEGTYQYKYVRTGNGLNLPLKVISPNGNKIEYKYDFLNRPIETKETVNNQEYYTLLEYNQDNRLEQYTYPGGFSVNYVYDSKGYNTEIKRTDNGLPIWRINEISAAGQFTKYTLGNNAQTENTFSNFGLLAESKTVGIQNFTYNFDATNGNMLQRKDVTKNLIEDFTYDNLDRLTSIKLNNVITGNYTYMANGNISNSSDLGLYSYGVKPNAVSNIEDPSNLISHQEQTIAYTSFNKMQQIQEGNFQLNLSYGPFDERKHSVLKDVNSQALLCERYYLNGFEKTIRGTNVYETTYINSPTGLAAMYVKQNGANQGTMHYVYTDNLGSITTLVDDAGNKIEQSFDVWGKHRNPTDWTILSPLGVSSASLPEWLYRGYTGHEHLNEFALINMNGRMYDPVVARFLSPDKLLQNPTNTQNYNGYSYVMNNPLKYNDPSGWAYQWYKSPVARPFQANGNAHEGGAGEEGFNAYRGKKFEFNGIPISNERAATLMRPMIGENGKPYSPYLVIDETKVTSGYFKDDIVSGYWAGCGCAVGETETVKDGNGNTISINLKSFENRVWVESNKFSGLSWWNFVRSSEGMLQAGFAPNISFDSSPTLINNTNATIWVKPEDNSLSPISLAPGKSTTIRVDGVTHPSYPGQVFKVRSGFDILFGIEANQDGVIVGANSALWPLPAEANYLFGGGWLTAPPNAGWNDIFNRAGYKKP